MEDKFSAIFVRSCALVVGILCSNAIVFTNWDTNLPPVLSMLKISWQKYFFSVCTLWLFLNIFYKKLPSVEDKVSFLSKFCQELATGRWYSLFLFFLPTTSRILFFCVTNAWTSWQKSFGSVFTYCIMCLEYFSQKLTCCGI